MSNAERVYRALLHLYPAQLRDEFKRDMLITFRDARRDRRVGELRFWVDIGRDIVRMAFPAFVMSTMAACAVFVGVIVGGSAVVESALSYSHSRDALTVVALAAFILAGALIVTSGIALWRHGRGAAATVQRMAGIGLLLFATFAVQRPVLSMFARLLGFTFPAALVLFLAFRRRSRLS